MMERSGSKDTNRRWRHLLAEVPLMALLCVSSAYPFVQALGLRLSLWELAAACLALLIPLSVLMFRSRVAILTGIAVSVLAVAATLLLLLSDSKAAMSARQEIDSFLGWAAPYLKGFRTENRQYATVLGLLFTTLITVPICLFTVRRMDPFAALLPGLATVTALYIIGHTLQLPSVLAYLLAALLYALYGRYRRLMGAYSPDEAPGPAVFLASSLPMAITVVTLAVLLSSAVKLDPAWMKEARDRLLHKQNPVTDTIIRQSGEVNTGELGGVPALDDTVMMRVRSDHPDVYLKGLSKDRYTGHSWERSDTNKHPFPADAMNFTDTLETMSCPEAFSQENTVRIEYVNLNTPVVYLPLKTGIVALPESARPSLVGIDTVILDSAATAGFSYSATHLAVEENERGMGSFLSNAHKGYYSETGGDAADQFAGNANDAYLNNTGLPASLPARVRELAHQITGGSASDYEKAKAIENYLSSNYSYTTSPGIFDKNRDFVDQFLFEEKEGYCTYFATAMAVLLRCEGIPSRYVEGYVLPAGQVDGAYLVTKRQGHAWAEAYFEGLGWLQFEPTASYAGGARPTTSPTTAPTKAVETTKPAATPEPTGKAVSQAPANGSTPLPRGALWLAAALLVLLALGAVGYGMHLRATRHMNRMEPKDSVVAAFGQCVKLLELCGHSPQNGEDLREFARGVEKAWQLPGLSFEKSAEAFQLARFSNHEVSDELKDQLLGMRSLLLRTCRKKLGVFRHVYFTCLWGVK